MLKILLPFCLIFYLSLSANAKELVTTVVDKMKMFTATKIITVSKMTTTVVKVGLFETMASNKLTTTEKYFLMNENVSIKKAEWINISALHQITQNSYLKRTINQ